MSPRKRRNSMISLGVYVGETARSIFERSKEHWSDRLAEKEDSHMIKHWQIDHPELPEPPKFKFKVVASFQDALTRQVSEAVRIDLRGSGVLNSRSEYSRCRLPRLMIDTEEWRVKKKEEKKALEPDKIVTEICTEEEGIDNELAVEEGSARRMTSKR